MPTLPVYNTEGTQVGEITLNDSIFGAQVNRTLLHEAVVMQLASRRLGTVSVKNRTAVRGGGRKPWRQKGTGRARHGSRTSPIWRGGGVIFGPMPRSYSYKLPKTARRQAMKSALSAKVQAGELIVLDNLNVAEPKTKLMAGILQNLKVNKKALIVTAINENNVALSSRNLPGVLSLAAVGLNVYDILNYDHLILTKDAVAVVEEALA